eukprot:TRINITY_DN22121_c0_g1_i1.p1 TRINITY_DN22121_c0_g1~~TRINITY_DN22121_c0_g1_i1.p1  ORF type:complete len:283 (+),score=114.99 TRINITY_DN22121_c0_g1_i1:130-978(+)
MLRSLVGSEMCIRDRYFIDLSMRRGQAFASSLSLLAFVRVRSWNENKSFGIGIVVDESGNVVGDEETVLVHPSNFVKNPNGKTASGVRTKTIIQGDIGEFKGKATLENITSRDGAPLHQLGGFVGTRVNDSLMTKNLLSREGATAPRGARLDQTDFLLKTIVDSMRRIDEDLMVCRNAHKKTIQLLSHIAEKQGVKQLVVGDEYLAAKDKIWAKRTEHHKARKAAKEEQRNAGKKDDEESEVAKKVANDDDDDDKLEVDALLEETKAETAPGTGKKGKKSKK